MTTVAIIGSGMMGTALCWPLCDNGHTVHLVGTHLDRLIITNIHASRIHPRLERRVPDQVHPYYHTELAQAVQGVDLIVSGVSSFGVHWFADTAGPYLSPQVPILAVTKGLEDLPNGDLQILPDVINQRLPVDKRGKISLNAIGGPCTSHELAARRQTGVVFAGKERAVLEKLQAIFQTAYYHVNISTDLLGVEVCAAMKNAYALGVGLAVGMMEQAGPDGLAWSYNPQAALFAQGCLEMRRMLEIMGGGLDNVSALPGAGDLYVTIYGGRTVRLGKLLGQGIPYLAARQRLANETLESVEITNRMARALPKLEARGIIKPDEFPLLRHLDQIINHGQPVDLPWDKFFKP